MNTDTTGARRRELREVAEQIAPSWERRRPEIEAAAAEKSYTIRVFG